MKIGIIGMGYVGRAVEASWLGSQHSVKFYDPAVAGSVSGIDELINDRPGAIFVCVPTPSSNNGACDTTVIKDTLKSLIGNYSGAIIVKSTVPPDFWLDYKHVHNLYHVPEFLVARQAIYDYLNPEFIFVGGNNDGHDVIRIIRASAVRLTVPIITTDLVTASLVKYFMNSFLATKVTVLNQYHRLCEKLGGDWNKFTEMIEVDDRMGSSHNQVPGPDGQFGYGGACFPKDVRAIINSIQAYNVSAGIIEAVDSANTQFRGTE
jgi:nucleotide sugar dehydrogenase